MTPSLAARQFLERARVQIPGLPEPEINSYPDGSVKLSWRFGYQHAEAGWWPDGRFSHIGASHVLDSYLQWSTTSEDYGVERIKELATPKQPKSQPDLTREDPAK